MEKNGGREEMVLLAEIKYLPSGKREEEDEIGKSCRCCAVNEQLFHEDNSTRRRLNSAYHECLRRGKEAENGRGVGEVSREGSRVSRVFEAAS